MAACHVLPVLHHHADADAVREVVVVDEALAVSGEILDVAVEVLDQGEAHLELQGAAILVETEIVPEHERKVVIPPDGPRPDLPVAEVGSDVRVVVLAFILGDAGPGLEDEVEIVPLEPEVGRDPVPAPGERFAAPVGLVVEADLDETASQKTEEVPVGPVVDKDLGLVVRLAEGARRTSCCRAARRRPACSRPRGPCRSPGCPPRASSSG
jgi:hypothetical protein